MIDTAQADGASESMSGALLEKPANRAQYFLVTRTQIWGDYSNPQAAFDASFKTLRMGKIGRMQIHRLGGLAEFILVFEKAKGAGWIRYIGMSRSDDSRRL